MKLHTLKKVPGTKKRSIQIGRGNGSGRGNYSTRGLKGAGSRSGFSVKPFFA
jgi:large subunit ribosomal protein L15